MKLLKIAWLLAIACSAIFASCKKEKTEEEQLPPITQTGANIFGCLINGKIYTPKGIEQNTSNFRVFVDPNFNNGNIDVRVFRKDGDTNLKLNFGSDSAKTVGYYEINKRNDFSFRIFNINSGNLLCETPYSFGMLSSKNGFIKITRYDLPNGIISGEFEFHFSNPGCAIGDPIHITQGRFDKKL